MERNRSVEHLVTKLKISEEEALQLIEFDKMSHKPEPKPKAKSASTQPKPAAKKSPASNSKEEFIKGMVAFVEGEGGALGPQQLKSNSITFKDAAGNYYTLALTAHKGCPQGYRG